jgi:hypothetical protein
MPAIAGSCKQSIMVLYYDIILFILLLIQTTTINLGPFANKQILSNSCDEYYSGSVVCYKG